MAYRKKENYYNLSNIMNTFPINDIVSRDKGFIKTVPKRNDSPAGLHQINGNRASTSEGNSRWLNDGGPIGQAIKDGNYELLKRAIKQVRLKSIELESLV